jgi:hypothetical protein
LKLRAVLSVPKFLWLQWHKEYPSSSHVKRSTSQEREDGSQGREDGSQGRAGDSLKERKEGPRHLHQQVRAGRTLHQHKDASNQQEETHNKATELYTSIIPKPQGGRTLKIPRESPPRRLHQTKDQTEVATTNQTKR